MHEDWPTNKFVSMNGQYAVRLVIFSANRYGARAVWQEIIGREMCEERTEVKGDPRSIPIIVCRF